MYDNDDTWEEWVEQLLIVSGGDIDHTCISEETAASKYPNLYAYYEQGEDPEQYICENRIVYKDEGDYIEIWTDPDEPDDFDYELDAILSNDDFYGTFTSEISNLKSLNAIDIDNLSVAQTLRRQIFVGAITCLETYLSDAFINTVSSNQELLKSFFKSFDIFKERKIKMSAVFDTIDSAKDIAIEEMLKVLYHNIPKVKKMYKTTLDISFPKIEEIAKYVAQRHDLVHRNGKEPKLKSKAIFLSKEYVGEVIINVEYFINEIDRQLKDKETKWQSKSKEGDWDSIPF